MDADWVKSASARRILVHWADPRPAWLWSQDGATLLWRNRAARFFTAKVKKQGLRLGADPVPIKGQVSRLIRLGSPGRSSLSRVQFLAGDKPLSATTTVTPVETPGGVAALLVGVDAIDADLLATDIGDDPLIDALFPRGWTYTHLDADGTVLGGTAGDAGDLADASGGSEEAADREVVRLKASPQGQQLVLIAGETSGIESVRSDEGYGYERPDVPPAEPPLPLGLPPLSELPPVEVSPAPVAPEDDGRVPLSSLFDRLAETESLYGELTVEDEEQGRPESADAEAGPLPVAIEAPSAPVEEVAGGEAAPVASEPDVIAAVIEFEEDLGSETPAMFRVTAREFLPVDAIATEAGETDDRAAVERTSRYNFDELSRILTDRVSSDEPAADAQVEIDAPMEPVRVTPVPEGALINVGAETFILNRLPLGILVFRDQQVLFANRALTDLVGHETIDSLRAAGLTSIFPGDDAATAGPVTQLVRRDGQLMPVTARLQSITWQGRPALLLSAHSDPRASNEIAVRGFAETLAMARGEGFIAADRSGVVTSLSDRARELLASLDGEILGKPLAELIVDDGLAALRKFLEHPARFAETVRPSLVGRVRTGAEFTLFAEGQAGIVSGYFGYVRDHAAAPTRQDPRIADDIDPLMLSRVSRGVRRPLNTIIGFADLIRSAAFGTIENHRYVEYARDIKTAGQEIAVLVDELDDFARLQSGKFAVRPADLDLAGLLESCIVRVRGQAGAARVLVRSAISERLPRVHADRASLGQAVLNLLASAIDQTPPGGTVVLSAQADDDGSIAVNVRDSGSAVTDPGERFVVFRDGVGKNGETLAPVRSSVGLALTRSLVAVNACRLTVDPAGAVGTLFSVQVPADLVVRAAG